VLFRRTAPAVDAAGGLYREHKKGPKQKLRPKKWPRDQRFDSAISDVNRRIGR
jgi:hypothetical protein